MTEQVVEVNGLWTRFGRHAVHRGIELSVARGDVLSLVGGSGSGKTTLLRQMMGLERPSRGSRGSKSRSKAIGPATPCGRTSRR